MKIKTPAPAKPEPSSLRRRQTGASSRSSRKPGSGSTESALERGEHAEKAEPTHQNPPQARPKMPVGEDIDLYFLLKETVNYFSIDHTDRGENNTTFNAIGFQIN